MQYWPGNYNLLSVPEWYEVKYAVTAQTSLAPLTRFHGWRVTTAHVHQCCIFQSYAKTVPSRMKLTMREAASMTTDTWSRRVTSDFNSVLSNHQTFRGGSRGAFHQAFCQCFSLTNLLSANQMQGFQKLITVVSEKHWQNAWWNAPPPPQDFHLEEAQRTMCAKR